MSNCVKLCQFMSGCVELCKEVVFLCIVFGEGESYQNCSFSTVCNEVNTEDGPR